jgi:hypothetical protein
MWETIANFSLNPEVPPATEEVDVDTFVREQVYPRMKEFWGYDGPKPK